MVADSELYIPFVIQYSWTFYNNKSDTKINELDKKEISNKYGGNTLNNKDG